MINLQNSIGENTKRTEALADIQEVLNTVNENGLLTTGEQVNLQNQLTEAELATSIESGKLAELITFMRDNNIAYSETLQTLLDQYKALPETTTIAVDAHEVFRRS